MGRPSDYSTEAAAQICQRLMGGESLRSICDSDEMPDKATVFRWLAANEVFRDQYARAREIQAEILAEEIVEIADDGSNDYMEVVKRGNPTVIFNKESVMRSNLRVDARKWVAAKLLPKKYGERVQQDVNLNVGDSAVRAQKLIEAAIGRPTEGDAANAARSS